MFKPNFSPFQPIAHPGAWTGTQLIGRKDWIFQLNDTHRAELDAALQATSHLPVETLDANPFSLPNLGSNLAAIQDSLENGSGATVIRGLPVQNYSEDECRRLFWGISTHLGVPVSQNAAGERIFSVRDEGYADDDVRARGPNTRKKLSFHTDRCDVIGFCCLQAAKSGGENEIVSSMAIYNRILKERPDLLEVLLQPFFYKRHNVDTGNQKPYCKQPIFSFHQGHFASAFLRVLIERASASDELPDMTPQQKEALDLIETIAAETSMHVQFLQQPGDILFLNNWVNYHRRTKFEDFSEPEKRRHILRIWLSPPNSRPLAPWFEANYGSTKAGAVRGGMRAEA